MIGVETALVSVYEKSNIVEFATELKKLGVEIISTGGTGKLLQDSGIEITSIADYTNSPEMLDGRVKTLHPKIHAGLLAVRSNSKHMQELKNYDVKPIDMVISNLYPFEEAAKDPEKSLQEILENIDIGGLTMLRAASKNYQSVVPVSSPKVYKKIAQELRENKGKVSEGTSFKLAINTFNITSRYDSLITSYFSKQGKEKEKIKQLPIGLSYHLDKITDLRYGENPHQKAAFYKDLDSEDSVGISYTKKLHGKKISFNNILDLDAALKSSMEFSRPAVSVIKHTNPCGIAVAGNITEAFENAYNCDPMSAFGSIIGFNKKVNQKVAKMISKKFVECVIAPEYEKEALEILKKKKNIRLLKYEIPRELKWNDFDTRKVTAGLLVQEQDKRKISKEDLKIVTDKKPTEVEIKSLLFGFRVVKFIKSNAIVLTQGEKTVGIGAGQPSRVDAVKIAIRKAGDRATGACLASDAFFPMPDNIEEAANSGVKAIIQPGGSIRDEKVIKAANEFGISMVFTGMRHFRH